MAAVLNRLRSAVSSPGESVPIATAPAKPKPGLFGAIVECGSEFSKNDGMTQAAALAFYTGLALAPLLSIAVWITQAFVGTSQKATDAIVSVATQVIGSQAAAPIKELIGPASAAAKGGMTLTGLLSIAFLAVSASGVFAQLQSSLNIMWNVKTDVHGSGIVSLIRKRLFSFGMLFTLLFLMLISMVASFVLEAMRTYVEHFWGDGQHAAMLWTLNGVNLLITLIAATGVFALIFKYLPDVKVPWRDTIVGALITAVLFMVGKFAIGLYLGRGSYETSYGAAIGSFVALLVWVYYSSTIIFIGVEATQVYARRHGHEPVAEDHAVKTQRTEQVVETPESVQPTTYSATRTVANPPPTSTV